MSNQASLPKKSDKWIPFYFVIFFFVIFLVDGTFVTTAITTQTGMVTKDPYEKGLSYNKILIAAQKQNQIHFNQKASYTDNVLSWKLSLENGNSINDAIVTAHFYRPAKDGDDFDIVLTRKDTGIYEARPQFSHPGLWIGRLEAQWQNLQSETLSYKTTLEIMAP